MSTYHFIGKSLCKFFLILRKKLILKEIDFKDPAAPACLTFALTWYILSGTNKKRVALHSPPSDSRNAPAETDLTTMLTCGKRH